MKRVLLLVGMLFSTSCIFAQDNVLQTIEIEPVKDTYNIVLVADKAVDVKKEVQSSNKITLTMKNITASKTLNTVYNNVTNVDSVMVEPKGNGVTIFFQADNAEHATIAFDSLAAPAPIAPIAGTKKIKLNNPIESYAPIYKEDYSANKTSNFFNKLKSSQAVDSLKDSIDEEGGAAETAHKFFSYGLIAVLAIAVFRLFKRKDSDMKIGLSQSLNDREMAMFKGMSPIQPQNQPLEKPFTTMNYGLNAYQKESRNPYETAPMQFHNPRLKNMQAQAAQQEALMQTLAKSQAATMTATQPQIKKMTTPVNTAPVNQSNPNVDNIKFLESMTAIYEKSGRHDLARGLKASLSKNNIQ
ncbi:MAG: hypothetical protein MJ231_05615 [bacterium]|nr:hypothetical protein [bacterium]